MAGKEGNSKWEGLVLSPINQAEDGSFIRFLSITNSVNGLMVENTNNISISDTSITNSVTDGLTLKTCNNVEIRLQNNKIVNSGSNGILINCSVGSRTRKIFINNTLITGNALNGIYYTSGSNIDFLVENSAFFRNGENGILAEIDSINNIIQINNIVSASNGRSAMKISKINSLYNSDQSTNAIISKSNITGHWQDSSIILQNIDYVTISKNRFWENYNGCINVTNTKWCPRDISIDQNRFVHNKGSIMTIVESGTCQRSNYSIGSNNITLNLLNNRLGNQYSISASYDTIGAMRIMENEFIKNTMNAIVFLNSTLYDKDNTSNVALINNSFRDNLSPDTILLNASSITMLNNVLNNPISKCEIKNILTTQTMKSYQDLGIPQNKLCYGLTQETVSSYVVTDTIPLHTSESNEILIATTFESSEVKSGPKQTRLLTRPEAYVLQQPLVVE